MQNSKSHKMIFNIITMFCLSHSINFLLLSLHRVPIFSMNYTYNLVSYTTFPLTSINDWYHQYDKQWILQAAQEMHDRNWLWNVFIPCDVFCNAWLWLVTARLLYNYTNIRQIILTITGRATRCLKSQFQILTFHKNFGIILYYM